MNPAMFVVLWKGSSCWGEWDRAFYELQHPDDVQSMNLHVFFKPLENLKVETVKHLLLSAWFLLVLWQCWSARVGNSRRVRRSWDSPWCILSGWCQQATPKGRSSTSDVTHPCLMREWKRVSATDESQTSVHLLCLYFCVWKKKLSLFRRGDKTRVASISSISPPSGTRVLLCFYLWFLPCCVAVVHPQMNLAACSAAAWCIVTFSTEPILMRRHSFLCAAIACCCSCCSISFIICDSWGK